MFIRNIYFITYAVRNSVEDLHYSWKILSSLLISQTANKDMYLL